MKVEERGHHSHGQWKLGLQVHVDQPRSKSELGESQRKSRSNYFSPCCGGECSFSSGGVIFLLTVDLLMYARHRRSRVTYAWYDNQGDFALLRSRDDRGSCACASIRTYVDGVGDVGMTGHCPARMSCFDCDVTVTGPHRRWRAALEPLATMNAKIIYGTAWYVQYMSFHTAAKWFAGRRNELLR